MKKQTLYPFAHQRQPFDMLFIKLVPLLVIALVVMLPGCSAVGFSATPTPQPTATRYPTYTPQPTYTPNATQTPYPTLTAYPTYTPIPPTATPARGPTPQIGDVIENFNWRVKAIRAEPAKEFGSFFMKADAANRMVIVTLEYTNLRPDSVEFFPESVLMAYTGTAGLRGWVRRPTLYRSGLSSQITNFEEEAVYNSIPAGATRTDTFVYEWKETYSDFLLLFPESEPIVVRLDQAQ